MWTNVIDDTAEGFCRSLHGVAGHFPPACQVDAGRPALYFAIAGAIALAFAARLAWNKVRAVSS